MNVDVVVEVETDKFHFNSIKTTKKKTKKKTKKNEKNYFNSNFY